MFNLQSKNQEMVFAYSFYSRKLTLIWSSLVLLDEAPRFAHKKTNIVQYILPLGASKAWDYIQTEVIFNVFTEILTKVIF